VDLFDNLIFGLAVAISLQNLLYCFIGVLVGTLIGVLPGIGPLATIAMLLPLTYGVPPVAALIMLAGIYYGAQYGGSTTAILVNLPGETSSVVTCIDGYQVARQGRAGPALAIAAIGSFFAGTVGTLLIALFGPPLAEFALKFGSPEYFSLMLMGLVAAAALAQGDMAKSLAMVAFGLLLASSATTSTPACRASPSASPSCWTASASSCWPSACSPSARSSPISALPPVRASTPRRSAA
jgi:putative tricarboxylic transport membrane protein